MMDRKKDGTIFPVHLSVAAIMEAEGTISHYVAVHEDLSAAEQLQKKMMQSQKMESVGVMAGGIAHDFNNLLAGLVGNLYLLRMHYPEHDEISMRTRDMESSIRHGARLIQQMLTFARKDRPEIHFMHLRPFIKEAFRLASASLPENIDRALVCPETGHMAIQGDATQLQQVLLNLVTNARHAVDGLEHPSIRLELTTDVPPTTLLAAAGTPAASDNWCCIRCIDNGCGISPENIEHIFDPFFTTREVGMGTGLGLAMVYGAVQNHAGLIDVESEPGRGTTLTIYLPQAEGEAVHAPVVEDVRIDGKGRGILLVDDEQGLRTVFAEVLQQNGFTLWQAADGELAVATYAKYRAQIDLVLMDVVMPNKGGVAAALEIRAMDEHVPIIFQTGYGEETQLTAAQSIAHSHALQKPVKIDALLQLIQSSLDF